MKAHRLLSILMLLQAHGRLTAGAIARSLEVSERTVLRDIDQLSAAGVPLWGERGHQGGFQLQPGWTTQLTGMTGDEANALWLAGLPGPATALGLGEAAASARLKLMASVPAPWRDQAAVRADMARLCGLWGELLAAQPGKMPDSSAPLLFGHFSIADATFAPICMRIRTYGLPLPADLQAYVDRVAALPGVKAWIDGALAEHDFLDFEEPYRLGR